MDTNEDDQHHADDESAEATESKQHNSGTEFGQQVSEASESAVGEGPQNPEAIEDAVRFEGLEGNMLMDETPPTDAAMQPEEGEQAAPGPSLLLETPNQTKVGRNLFGHRLRKLIHNPNTWRVIKSLVVIIIAIKLFNSYEALEQYIPTFGNEE